MTEEARVGPATERALLIGGPKHASYLNLEKSLDRWELIESNLLAGLDFSQCDERYRGNIYVRDRNLSRILNAPVFTHNVINGPDHGSEILPKMVKALNAAEAATKRLQTSDKTLRERDAEIKELTAELGKARDVVAIQDAQLRSIRVHLERIGGEAAAAVLDTGMDYKSFFVEAP